MAEGRSKTGLQVLIGLIGCVAIVTGTATVFLGADSVVGVSEPGAAADSEMRFFAVWYVAIGVLLLKSIPTLEKERSLVRVVGVAFFVAGCARVLSWASVGKPPFLAIILMVIELILPAVIVSWHAAITRQPRSSTRA